MRCSYHRNKWNQIIHFFFVPLILWSFAVRSLLLRRVDACTSKHHAHLSSILPHPLCASLDAANAAYFDDFCCISADFKTHTACIHAGVCHPRPRAAQRRLRAGVASAGVVLRDRTAANATGSAAFQARPAGSHFKVTHCRTRSPPPHRLALWGVMFPSLMTVVSLQEAQHWMAPLCDTAAVAPLCPAACGV